MRGIAPTNLLQTELACINIESVGLLPKRFFLYIGRLHQMTSFEKTVWHVRPLLQPQHKHKQVLLQGSILLCKCFRIERTCRSATHQQIFAYGFFVVSGLKRVVSGGRCLFFVRKVVFSISPSTGLHHNGSIVDGRKPLLIPYPRITWKRT